MLVGVYWEPNISASQDSPQTDILRLNGPRVMRARDVGRCKESGATRESGQSDLGEFRRACLDSSVMCCIIPRDRVPGWSNKKRGKERKKLRKNREGAGREGRGNVDGGRGSDEKEKQSSRRAGSGLRKKKSPR